MSWPPGHRSRVVETGAASPPCEAGGARRVTREHALSHGDLRRVLPRILAPASVRDTPTGLEATFPDGRVLVVSFEAETQSRIGALRIVSSRFTLEFPAWDETAVRQLLLRCEMGLQQGGG